MDHVDPASGSVVSRAEMPFTAAAVATASLVSGLQSAVSRAASPAGQETAREADESAVEPRPEQASPPPQPPAGSSAAPVQPSDNAVVEIPAIETARVTRGDSLWRISRHAYGEGIRYTIIYDANRGTISNPNRIYPGQVFVLPNRQSTR
jgi:nucleoid-associated protein YgaU